ncbi:MAG: AAA family ATPase [Anaerolineaceae bacterium 4572_78]|nr:MAG: AAA family ATPase [Anaerolineaceae bacterium 4572_78]
MTMEGVLMSDTTLTTGDFRNIATSIETAVSQVIVGQHDLIRYTLITLLAGGNALLEGVPGLGKTVLVRTISQVIDCHFSRIQFTPDLMPADIVGTNIIAEDETGKRTFRFVRGPIFANLVLADEINRATPKTQSAMLEAMQEKHVTVARQTHQLAAPFFVLATQNPLEMDGTYPLPEAQLDRFFFKISVFYPSVEELVTIAKQTTGTEAIELTPVADGKTIIELQQLARAVPVARHVLKAAARLVRASHPDDENACQEVRQFVRYGASPRGMQALILAGKIIALLDGRYNVAIADLQSIAHPVLRHRLILNFEAEVEGIQADMIIDKILEGVVSKKK